LAWERKRKEKCPICLIVVGIPLSDRKIRKEDMSWLPDKISRRVPP
jgi:hypothetical protein